MTDRAGRGRREADRARLGLCIGTVRGTRPAVIKVDRRDLFAPVRTEGPQPRPKYAVVPAGSLTRLGPAVEVRLQTGDRGADLPGQLGVGLQLEFLLLEIVIGLDLLE